tara:strand:- start:20 stop:787 length:768 start_codon:yes stop_codon:yes gene_type:complete
MKSHRIITSNGSKLNITGTTSAYRVLNYIWRAGLSGRRYTDILKYIVEEIKGMTYDSSMRGHWGNNLQGSYDRAGLLPRFTYKNKHGRYVISDKELISHFEEIKFAEDTSDGMVKYDSTGDKYWYKNGDLHRDGAPAIEKADGTEVWYTNGRIMTDAEVRRAKAKQYGLPDEDLDMLYDLGLFEKTIDEDMIAPMDSGQGSPGGFFQSPESMPTSMDTYSLLGPMQPIKKVKSKKKKKKANKVLSFKDFIGSTRK